MPRAAGIVIWATLGVSLYLYVTQWTYLFEMGGFSLHIHDLLILLTSVYCVGGVLVAQWRFSGELILIALCALFIISFGRGVLSVDVNVAGVQFRPFAEFASLSIFVY